MFTTKEAEGTAEDPRAATISRLRAQIASLTSGAETLTEENLVRCGEPLAAVLPSGGLPRRSLTTMSPCAALAVEMIAGATAAGLWAGVVGWPQLSFAGVTPAGGRLDRIIAVPHPQEDPMVAAGILVEGVDLVFAYRPTIAPPPLRLRRATGALVGVGSRLPGAALRIDAHIVGFHGLGWGSGRIRAVDVAVTAGQRTSVLTVGSP